MKIVTVSSHRPWEAYYVYDQFFASANKFGYQPLVLKEGYQGLGTKPAMLKRAIESGQITDEYICFTDCWDVVFQSDPLLGLHRVKNQIVFNAEKNCWPDPKLADKFPESTTPYRFLNSGFSMGPTALYLEALKAMNADSIHRDYQNNDGTWVHYEDQLPWQKQYLFGNVPIALDHQCELCQTLHDVKPEELDFSGEKIRNKEIGSEPIAFHANGSGKTNGCREAILNHLKL